MTEKKAMMLGVGAGLLGLSGALSVLSRLNRTSNALQTALDRMKSMPGWDEVERNRTRGVGFVKFLAKGSDEDHRALIRSYVNFADEGIGDLPGRIGYNLRRGRETMDWLRSRGLWRLPKELRGPMPVDSRNPAWHSGEAPGRLLHFRELGGHGKVRSMRHWFIESRTSNMKDFKGLTDTDKKLIRRYDKEVAEEKAKGLSDDDIFETMLHRDWMKPHLRRIVISKHGVFNPHDPMSFTQLLPETQEMLSKFPGTVGDWANPFTVRTALGGGLASTGLGGAQIYRDATKPWHEKWRDEITDWIT